jgi:hypothetical protein
MTMDLISIMAKVTGQSVMRVLVAVLRSLLDDVGTSFVAFKQFRKHVHRSVAIHAFVSLGERLIRSHLNLSTFFSKNLAIRGHLNGAKTLMLQRKGDPVAIDEYLSKRLDTRYTATKPTPWGYSMDVFDRKKAWKKWNRANTKLNYKSDAVVLQAAFLASLNVL